MPNNTQNTRNPWQNQEIKGSPADHDLEGFTFNKEETTIILGEKEIKALNGRLPKSRRYSTRVNGEPVVRIERYLREDPSGTIFEIDDFKAYSWKRHELPPGCEIYCANPWHLHREIRRIYPGVDGWFTVEELIPLCDECMKFNEDESRKRLRRWNKIITFGIANYPRIYR